MRASRGALPKTKGWAFELKWSGVRALVVNEPGLTTITDEHGRTTLWRVTPGMENVRSAWEAGGLKASLAARVAAAGRPLFHAVDLDLSEFGDCAREAGLRWAVAFPLFAEAEVIGAVEACAVDVSRFDALVRAGLHLGSLTVASRRAA